MAQQKSASVAALGALLRVRADKRTRRRASGSGSGSGAGRGMGMASASAVARTCNSRADTEEGHASQRSAASGIASAGCGVYAGRGARVGPRNASERVNWSDRARSAAAAAAARTSSDDRASARAVACSLAWSASWASWASASVRAGLGARAGLQREGLQERMTEDQDSQHKASIPNQREDRSGSAAQGSG